jgi:hypothetical protein
MQQIRISPPIDLADLFRGVGDIELDRPTATRLKVHEQQPSVCAEQVAWMRFTVQQLFVCPAIDHRVPASCPACPSEAPGLGQKGSESPRVAE